MMTIGGGAERRTGRIMIVDFEKAGEREERITHSSTGIYVTLTLEHNNCIRAEAVSFQPIRYINKNGVVSSELRVGNYDERGNINRHYETFLQMLTDENNVGQILGLSQDELLTKCLRVSRRLRNIEAAVEEH